jgi:hypothetical protein
MQMADLSQLQRLKLWLEIKDSDTSQDGKLQLFLDAAESKIKEARGNLPEEPMEPRWNLKQIEIAVYLYNKQGAEGEIGHSENGTSRSYESASIPPSILSDISPIVRVVE